VWAGLINELRPRSVGMGGDQPLTSNSTTLQSITEMVVAVEIGEDLDFEAMVYYTSGTAADLKLAWTFPSSSTLNYSAIGLDTALAFSEVVSKAEASDSAKSFGGAGTSSERFVWYRGNLVAGATGGFQLRAAQNAAVVETENIKASSWIEMWRAF